MELHTVDRQVAVADGHHLAVGCRGGDLEHVRDAGRRERVVAPGRKVLGQAREDSATVVRDRRRLAVDELTRGPHLAPESLHDRLVAEADAQRGRPWREPFDDGRRGTRVLRTAWA